MDAGGATAGRELRTGTHYMSLLCRGVDTAIEGCTDYSCRLDHTTAARQYWPSWWRDSGTAWPRSARIPPPGRPILPSSSCMIEPARIICTPFDCCVHPTA